MIKLGSHVKDYYTGFSGIAVSRAEYLYGCTQIEIQPTMLDKNGNMPKLHWFDEQRVELVSEEAAKVSPESAAVTGGPQNHPPKRMD